MATTPAAVTSSPAATARTIRRRRAAGGMGRERAGVLDQPPSQRPGLGARAQRQQLAAPGGVAEPGDQGVQPRGPHQPHAEALGQRPAADPVDLQLGVPPGDQPAGGDQRAAAAGQAEAPVHHRGADHRSAATSRSSATTTTSAAARPSLRVGPVEVGLEAGAAARRPAGSSAPTAASGHGEVAADQRCVEQPAVVEAGELLLRRLRRHGPPSPAGAAVARWVRTAVRSRSPSARGTPSTSEFLVLVRGRAGRGVDAHAHQPEEPVQRRRLDLDAADAVVGHRAHRPGEQPAGDDDRRRAVGVAEPPPGQRRGGQGEQGDADDERDDGRRPAAEARWPRRAG